MTDWKKLQDDIDTRFNPYIDYPLKVYHGFFLPKCHGCMERYGFMFDVEGHKFCTSCKYRYLEGRPLRSGLRRK